MSLQIKFTKMHGLGNDFVFANKTDLPAKYDLQKIISKVSERHLGLGCDQFILYEDKISHIDIEIYNSDGSSAEACGNATRCLAYLFSNSKQSKNIKIAVGSRMLECVVTNKEQVSVNMGEARFTANWMPKFDDLSKELSPYLSSNAQVLCVDLGNPHLVIIDQALSAEDMSLLGPRLEHNILFKAGVNVNFAFIIDDEIVLKVWERGAGFTYACGSGACASFAASRKLGFVGDKAKVKFQLGMLEMTAVGQEIIMSGGVTLIAEGIFYYG